MKKRARILESKRISESMSQGVEKIWGLSRRDKEIQGES